MTAVRLVILQCDGEDRAQQKFLAHRHERRQTRRELAEILWAKSRQSRGTYRPPAVGERLRSAVDRSTSA